ncbi:MAG: hypothetical protein PHU89_02210 [Bacilli bacterium]|nr:hypothetical protein [Bacilli bacterium]
MIEKVFKMSSSDLHVIEPVIKDENIHFMHMVLGEGESLKTHYTNANLYMTVVKGILSLSLQDEPFKKYEKGTILRIPINIKMNAQNHDKEILELYVVKAPKPEN